MAETRDFWSRRRAAVEAEAEAEAAALRVEETAQEDAAFEDQSDEEILEALGLPEPESLSSAEAVQDFMSSAVPQRLKRRALRTLWRLNPVLANLDGLVEYGEDYTDAATVVENLQTAYEVGRGMLARFEDIAEADDPDNEDAANGVAILGEEDATPTQPEDLEPEVLKVAAEDTALAVLNDAPAALLEVEPEYQPVPQRRMRFSFEETA